MKLRWTHVLAVLVIAFGVSLVVACGGGDKEEQVAETPAATAQPEEEVDEGGEEVDQGEEQLTEPARAFADLNSYRYALQFDIEATAEGQDAVEGPVTFGFNVEGEFVAPDRRHVRVTGSALGLDLEEESITIGDRVWVRTDSDWRESAAELASEEFSPSLFIEAFDADELSALKPDNETVNGVPSLRYELSKANIEQLRSLAAFFGGREDLADVPEDFDIDLWLAEEGLWPVRVNMSFRGDFDGGEGTFELSMDITDVNDESIEIEPPA